MRVYVVVLQNYNFGASPESTVQEAFDSKDKAKKFVDKSIQHLKDSGAMALQYLSNIKFVIEEKDLK